MRSIGEPWYSLPPKQPIPKHVIIIGAGLAGAATAYMLAKHRIRATVLERHAAIAKEASGNPVGMVMPFLASKGDPLEAFYTPAFRMLRNQLEEFGDAAGWNPCGIIELATKKTQLSEIIASNPEVELLTADAAEDRLGIAINAGSALWMAQGGIVVPGKLCNAYMQAAGELVSLKTYHNAINLQKVGGGWQVCCDGGTGALYEADAVVIANAHEALSFDQSNWLSLNAVGGQITYLPKATIPGKLHCGLSYGGYLAPMPANENQYCLGATFDKNLQSVDLSSLAHQRNVNELRRFVDMGGFDATGELSGRVAFRTMTSDRLPIVGALPDCNAYIDAYTGLHHGPFYKKYPPASYHDGLYVSLGHGARGIVSTLISGAYIASLMTGEKLPLNKGVANNLHPGRFLVRRLRRG